VAEGRQIFPTMTVVENLEMGAVVPRARSSAIATMTRVLKLFPRLEERRRQPAGTLSGGEQQMLAIARCLMGKPRLLLLDEPSLGLAPVVVETVFAVIRDLNSRDGLTVILVEQNVAQSLLLADRGYVLESGRIVMSGSGAELLGNDGVRQAYIGL
jgi:branched-chain amino acid transport system ATP-binding protein